MTRPGNLPPRRFRVAELVALGWTDKQIAGDMRISVEAVEAHVGRIVQCWKLDPSKNRRVQITRRFLELSLNRVA